MNIDFQFELGRKMTGNFSNLQTPPRFRAPRFGNVLKSRIATVFKVKYAKAILTPLDGGVISIHPITDKLGRIQNANFVNEDGLYDVILDSRKPSAKKNSQVDNVRSPSFKKCFPAESHPLLTASPLVEMNPKSLR